MFNNIFKFGKNRKNNKNIIIGLLILVIGIFLTTDILKNTSLFKFREGIINQLNPVFKSKSSYKVISNFIKILKERI